MSFYVKGEWPNGKIEAPWYLGQPAWMVVSADDSAYVVDTEIAEIVWRDDYIEARTKYTIGQMRMYADGQVDNRSLFLTRGEADVFASLCRLRWKGSK